MFISGQIELYTHLPIMRKLVDALQTWNFRICAVFLLDSQFMLEAGKFFSGALSTLSEMISLELPAVNILAKMDLLNEKNKQLIDAFLEPNSRTLLEMENESSWNKKYRKLSEAIGQVVSCLCTECWHLFEFAVCR